VARVVLKLCSDFLQIPALIVLLGLLNPLKLAGGLGAHSPLKVGKECARLF
jgi:hypothetical protein